MLDENQVFINISPYLASLAVLVCMFLLITPASTYGGDGNLTLAEAPPPITGVCNDGTDNDGDGLTDGDDTGCTKLYSYDRSEYDMRDSDLTYELYDGSAPTSSGPTISIPANLTWNYLVALNDVSVSDTRVSEWYLDNFGYQQWAAGDIEFETLGIENGIVVEPEEGDAVVERPVGIDLAAMSDPESCGNGDRDLDEGNNLGCPKDFGFPDQLRTSSGSRTEDQVSTDISTELKDEFEVDVGIAHSNPLQQSDNPDYTMDFVGTEAEGEFIYDIESPANGGGHNPPDSEKMIEHQGIENAPDFYGKNRKIRMMWPKAEETEIGKVEDYDRVKETGLTDMVSSTVSVSTCEDPKGNFTCAPASGKGPCKSRDSNTVKHYKELKDDTKTLTQTTYEYKIENTGGSSGAWQDPGYKDAKESIGEITVKVDRNLENGYTEVDARNCNARYSGEDCELFFGDNDAGSSCTDGTEEKDGYESEPIEAPDMPPGEAYTSAPSGKTSIKYEDIGYEKEDVFSTVYEDNTGMKSDIDSIQGLFGESYSSSQEENITYKNPYYSYEQEISDRNFSNSPAFSSSSFKVVVQDNKFHSKRDFYGVWNVDGSYGFGDSFVALKEGNIKNDPEPFLNETRIKRNDGVNPGFIKANEDVNFVGPGDYSSPSCPGNSVFCVSAADVTVKPFEDWSSGNSPGFEIETMDTLNVSEHWGVCRKYQDLIGGAKESILRCQYDWGDDFPSEPTPFWEPEVVPGGGG
jgi:hypothetical protein